MYKIEIKKDKLDRNTIKYCFTKKINNDESLTYADFISLTKEGDKEITNSLRNALMDATSELKSAYF
jgi:hypothetical protein